MALIAASFVRIGFVVEPKKSVYAPIEPTNSKSSGVRSIIADCLV